MIYPSGANNPTGIIAPFYYSRGDDMNIDKFSGKLILVNVNCNIWTGKTKQVIGDVKLGDGGEMLPDSIAELGNKNICDPTILRTFKTLRVRSSRTCEKIGMPFMGGYAIPVDQKDRIIEQLDNLRNLFNAHKDNVLRDYDNMIQQWVSDNQKYADILEDSLLDRSEVEAKLNFDFQLVPVEAIGHTEQDERLGNQVANIAYDLVDEMALTLSEFFNKNFAGRDSVSRKTCKTLEKTREKLATLTFLHSNLAPCLNLIDRLITLYGVSTTGKMEGSDFYQAMSIVLMLNDKEKMHRLLDGDITESDLIAGIKTSKAIESNSIVAITDCMTVPDDTVHQVITEAPAPAESMFF